MHLDASVARAANGDLAAMLHLVARMRQAQRRYFSERTLLALEESKKLERAVDKALKDIADRFGHQLF